MDAVLPAETAPYQVPSGDYLGAVLRLRMARVWPLIAIPVVIMLAVGAFYDSRWLFVALIALFIVAPMVLSLVYTRYLLTPEAARAVMRQSARLDADGSLCIPYLPPLRRVKVDTPDGPEVRYETVEPSSPLPPPERFSPDDVAAVTANSSYRIYRLRRQPLRRILIPHTAFTQQ